MEPHLNAVIGYGVVTMDNDYFQMTVNRMDSFSVEATSAFHSANEAADAALFIDRAKRKFVVKLVVVEEVE